MPSGRTYIAAGSVRISQKGLAHVAEPVTRSPWLPFGAKPTAGIRLLCLPHAGAGASFYRAWGTGLPGFVGVCPVQPPGRERRHQEQPLTSAAAISARLAPEVLAAVTVPYAIFGHSTGALCAFELAREIRRENGPDPAHLFVAGRQAPQLPMERTVIDGMSVAELAAELRRLGGTPEELLDDPDLLGRFQPLLAADFAVNEAYAYRPEPPLDIPITAFAATQDPLAGLTQMLAWDEHTTAEFRLHALNGGHFAVFDREQGALDQIGGVLDAIVDRAMPGSSDPASRR
jgi:medium-chain acyl-[acyl-carrier-protein] hydrolase